MDESNGRPEVCAAGTSPEQRQSYQTPTVEVICLDCEISAYAPDEGDVPLF